ncbi:MAG: carbon-nitrogen family hydrolase [Verrucomicrobiales bacterium]|nr:carbon-nitrogen family hydrolase [Verrucomicrobiales bacterium]
MDLHCFQTNTAWEAPVANFGALSEMVDARAGTGSIEGSLLFFPELCSCGFSMNTDEVCEEADGPSCTFFSDLARRHRCFVIAGIASKVEGSSRGANEAVCFQPDGSELSRYRKVHPFPLAAEGDHYLAGDDVVIFEINGWKIAPFICYDLRFPELFRIAAARGAEVFPVIANWPAPRVEHWLTLLKARAIENQAYVLGVNRCGSDPNLNYSGNSLIVGPMGEEIAKAGAEEACLSVSLERGSFDEWRAAFPALGGMKLITDPTR